MAKTVFLSSAHNGYVLEIICILKNIVLLP